MPKKEKAIVLFKQNKIRRHWNKEKELWYFSVVDIVNILTESSNSNSYWRKLKQRLREEGNQTVTNCHVLKMKARDGKMRGTDCFNTEDVFRLIQSIPSPKAEPFKLWLAKVGYERVEEVVNPELAFNRAMKTYLRKGYSRDWINQRLKGLKKGGLRDNMTNLELVLNMLGEVSTKEISKSEEPETFNANMGVAKDGGSVAGVAREALEKKTGKKVITSDNAKKLISN